MRKFRRMLFFWSLVVLFFIVAPTVVMRTRGYRFDFNHGILVHSGTVSLKMNPKDADIFINDKLEKYNLNRINNSFNINGVRPGTYSISVRQEGFQSWNKQAEVHSGLSTEFWNIILARNEYEKTFYKTSGIEKFFISPKDHHLAYTQMLDNRNFVRIMDSKKKAELAFFEIPLVQSRFATDELKENIEWAPEEDYLSVPIVEIMTNKKTGETSERVFYYIIEAPTEPIKNYWDLNLLTGRNDIRRVRWDPQEKGYLFFLSNNQLIRFNVNNPLALSVIAENVSSYDLSPNAVYFSKKPNEIVYKTSLDGQSEKTQLTFDFPGDVKNNNEKLIVYDDQRMAFLNSDKNLYVFNKGEHADYFKNLASEIEGLHFSNDGKKLLFWNKNEISVHFLRDWTVQPTRYEGETNNITRYINEIANVQWHKDYEHVIFSVGPEIKIIELDPRDIRNCMNLVTSNQKEFLATYNHSQEILFFIDKKDNLPELASIIFPESENFLGF